MILIVEFINIHKTTTGNINNIFSILKFCNGPTKHIPINIPTNPNIIDFIVISPKCFDII